MTLPRPLQVEIASCRRLEMKNPFASKRVVKASKALQLRVVEPPHIVIVAAIGRGRVIGVENRLPWRLPEDLRRFKEITSGHPIVMGRRTFESLGRPLPNRLNVVVSRRHEGFGPGVVVAASLNEAITVAQEHDSTIFVIGGAAVYDEALRQAEKIEATFVYESVEGDTLFPRLDQTWHILRRTDGTSTQTSLRGEPLRFSFLTLARSEADDGCDLCVMRRRENAAVNALGTYGNPWELGLAGLSAELGLRADTAGLPG